jgi:zinc transporter ZupT
VPNASYTSISEDIGEVGVAVPLAGVAGRFADNVTVLVGTGLYTVCVTWIGCNVFWFTTPVCELTGQPLRNMPALFTR